MTEPARSPDLALQAAGIIKTFGRVVANHDASLAVTARTIHALVGENGAGKSTLMRIVCGLEAPDAGTLDVFGRTVTGWPPRDALDAGVGMVHQHSTLVPTLTVAENIALGREPTRDPMGIVLDRRAAAAAVERLVRDTGVTASAGRRVGDLSVGDLSIGDAQRVELLRVLARGVRLLVLDEPTAVLTPGEVDDLWTVLRRLRGRGATIVLITHKLDEVMAISDAVTVMRAGRTIATWVTADTTPGELARAIVGRTVLPSRRPTTDATGLPLPQPGQVLAGQLHDPIFPALIIAVSAPLAQPSRAPPADSIPPAPLLDVRELVVTTDGGRRAVDRVSLHVAPGEILGIAGVEGNGQSELVEAVAGIRRSASGTIWLDGRNITDASVGDRILAGLSHIPEDRHRRGLVLDYSIADNLILGRQARFTRRLAIDRSLVRVHAQRLIAEFDIRPPDPASLSRALSGGNQQKIVVAREAGSGFRVLLAAQPTRGVDVGASELIHDRLRSARGAGRGILLVSADLDEIFALADRIVVMYRGRLALITHREDATVEMLGRAMTGAGDGREESARQGAVGRASGIRSDGTES